MPCQDVTNNCLGLSAPGKSSVSFNQEKASALSGNIGRVVAKVIVWDHDPFLARPNQSWSYSLSNRLSTELSVESPEDINNIQFELGGAFLHPNFKIHDMFIGTLNPALKTQLNVFENPTTGNKVNISRRDLDLVGTTMSTKGSVALPKLPGGTVYNQNGEIDPDTGRDIFPHQLWLHVGNLFKMNMIARHPSEYGIDKAELSSTQDVAISPSIDKFTMSEIHASAIWDLITNVHNGVNSVWPYQINKHAPGGETVHWTLEKYTSVWQGEDFTINVYMGDKKPDTAEDTHPPDELVDTNWNLYKYLMYEPKNPPETQKQNNGEIPDDKWVPGISNAAFWTDPKADETGNITNEAVAKAKEESRNLYWWKYKNYILIEIGANDPKHNYFIELVSGRKPRFLHLGEEWDNPNRLLTNSLNPDDFTYMKKCRVLSIYESLSVDDLFKKTEFGISVRNHLGRIVITFGGYESTPWVISRLDNDPSHYDFSKTLIPIVVPAGKMRLHGGNLSCGINFSPTKYVQTSTIPFRNRQADSYRCENKDLYMTFSQMGNNIKYGNPSIKTTYFNDPRLPFSDVGYDCDASSVTELNKNRFVSLNLHNLFPTQYKAYGKGYILEQETERTSENPAGAHPAYVASVQTRSYSEHKLKSGLVTKHSLSFVNLANQTANHFQFGLTSSTEAFYPYKEYVSKFDVGINLNAGSVAMPKLSDANQIDSFAKGKLFNSYVTPIINHWRLMLLGGEKPVEGQVEPFDISCLVTQVTDGWSADGFTSLNHECKIKCYIPLGIPSGGELSTSQAEQRNIHSLGQKLLGMHDQAFYVTVSYWWEDGIGERDAPGNKIERKGPPSESDLLIQCTGIAYGGELEKSVNKLFMNFSVKDYMTPLEHQKIFNSPFFDGVSDVVAVYELAKLASFDDDSDKKAGIDRRPLGFLQKVIHNATKTVSGKFTYNGEESFVRTYDLPGRYNTIVDPGVIFQNGESFASAMKKIASLSGKIIYFDRWGVLRFENLPAMEAAFSNDPTNFKPIFNFVTTPFHPTQELSYSDGDEIEEFRFDPREHASHLVYNVVNYSRSMDDCINQLVMVTASNEIRLSDGARVGGIIVEGYTFFEQLWDPEAEGFLGYRRPFYQSNGVFGGVEQIRNGLAQYARMKYPVSLINFQTYGVPGLKALDIITLDGNLFYITEISHEIDPSTNSWWMNISGEWLKHFTGDLGFLKETSPTAPTTPP